MNELFEKNNFKASKIIGIFDIENDKKLIDKDKIGDLTRYGLPKIKELFSLV